MELVALLIALGAVVVAEYAQAGDDVGHVALDVELVDGKLVVFVGAPLKPMPGRPFDPKRGT